MLHLLALNTPRQAHKGLATPLVEWKDVLHCSLKSTYKIDIFCKKSLPLFVKNCYIYEHGQVFTQKDARLEAKSQAQAVDFARGVTNDICSIPLYLIGRWRDFSYQKLNEFND